MIIFNQSASCLHVVNFNSISAFELKLKMARFVTVTDEDIHLFSEEQESENTKRKTFYDIKVFFEFLHSENEARNIHEIPRKVLGTVNVIRKAKALSASSAQQNSESQ